MEPDTDAVTTSPGTALPGRVLAARSLGALRVPPVAGIILIAALWLIARPYRGVRHDGILYLGQTLARLMPDTIGRDMFLAYGSQDRYSIFSRIMAPLVQHWGVAMPQIVVLFLCELVFIFGCWKLTSELPSRFLRWCAMVSLVSLSHTYGGQGSFAFAEPFLSARSMADPFVVLSLTLVLQGRFGWACAPMLLALAIHPLIALPALAMIWIYLLMQDRRWWWMLALVGAAALAGLAGIAPFNALWVRYDPEWWAGVNAANTNAFMKNETLLDWGPAIFDFGVLYLASRLLAGSALSRMLKSALICAVLFTVLWGIGADLMHDALLTQVQFWRVFWLTHLLSLLVLPVVLVDAWDRGPIGIWCAAGVALAALAVSANLPTEWLCVIWAGVPMVVLRRKVPVSAFIVRLATIVTVLGMLIVTAMVGVTTHATVANLADRFDGASVLQITLGLSLVTAATGSLVLRSLGSTGKWRIVGIAAVFALGAAALSWWDQRSDWQRFMEAGLEERGLPFEGMIPPNASVFWDPSLLEPWLLVHRPQFFSVEQGAGLLFNRQTSLEYARRQQVMSVLMVQKQLCNTIAELTGANTADPATCAPPIDSIRNICRTPGRPDYLIFRTRRTSDPTGSTATWTFPQRASADERTYRLYDCSKQP